MNDENKNNEIADIKKEDVVTPVSVVSNKIKIDDLKKIEIRVGQIKTADPVEGSEKLLILQVDFGQEERQIVSGIAKFFSTQELIGRKFAFVTNLEPIKLMGHASNGMILGAKDNQGQFSLLNLSQEIQNGTNIS
jgi:methionyl-tRNA synthetase